jgi:hypothetical protein
LASHLEFLCLRRHLAGWPRRVRLRRFLEDIRHEHILFPSGPAARSGRRRPTPGRLVVSGFGTADARNCAVAGRLDGRRFEVMHQGIVTAKTRRLQRELKFHEIPQRPLILDDKWDF